MNNKKVKKILYGFLKLFSLRLLRIDNKVEVYLSKTKLVEIDNKNFEGRIKFGFFSLPFFFNKILLNRVQKVIIKSNLESVEHIIFLKAHAGEVSIFLSLFLKSFVKNKPLKNILFVGYHPYHEDIVNSFFLNANFIYLPSVLINFLPFDFQYKDIRCSTIFPFSYFQVFEEQQHLDYISYMANYVGELPTSKFLPISLNEKKCDYWREKFQNEFVIIFPESQSCNPDDFFLDDIVSTVRASGLDFIINTRNPGPNNLFLDVKDLPYLAKKAKGIIAIRNGIVDFLLPLQKPVFLFYTGFPYREKSLPEVSAVKVHKLFSLANVPQFHARYEEVVIEDSNNREEKIPELKGWLKVIKQ
ncbi:hypothetical protein [Parasutterella sp.]|uniref:hypothetical protein n=1 Tax=Parasutterella sp. TaxID=2049037 RepID=UPI0035207231